MVHVEVDHGHAAQAVHLAGMQGGDGCLVEHAETHRPVGFGMVAAGPGGAEDVARLPLHHAVDPGAGRADAAHHRLPGAGGHDGVAGVEQLEPLLRRERLDRLDIVGRVHQQDLVERALGRFLPVQGFETGRAQGPQDREQARRRLRVAGAGFMAEAGLMGVDAGRHGRVVMGE